MTKVEGVMARITYEGRRYSGFGTLGKSNENVLEGGRGVARERRGDGDGDEGEGTFKGRGALALG